MNKTVSNERLKLLASYSNIVAAALLTTGVVGPIVAIVYGGAQTSLDAAFVIVSSLVCMLVSGGCHMLGRFILGALEE